MKKAVKCCLKGLTVLVLIAGFHVASYADDAMMKKDDMMMKNDAMMKKGDAMMMKDEAPVAIAGFCPVCVVHGMMNKGDDKYKVTYKGKVYKFAGEDQMKMFNADPESFTNGLEEKYMKLGGK